MMKLINDRRNEMMEEMNDGSNEWWRKLMMEEEMNDGRNE